MMNIFQCGLNEQAEEIDDEASTMIRCFPPSPSFSVSSFINDQNDPIMNTRSTRYITPDEDGSANGIRDMNSIIQESKTPPYDQHQAAAEQQQQQQAREQTQPEQRSTHEESPRVQQQQSQPQQQPQQYSLGDSELEERMKQLLITTSTMKDNDPNSSAPAVLALMYSQDDSLQVSAETSSVRFLPPDVADTMDLDYVEEYDNAFNEFLTAQPQFLIDNPDLVHNIRIIKLQKHLTAQANQESALLEEWEDLQHQKSDMEAGWHEQLRTAARKKAARETHLQSYLSGVHYNTKCMEAQLTWHMITDVRRRAQQQYALRKKLAKTAAEIDAILLEQQQDDDDQPSNPWLHQIPKSPEFDAIRDAMLAPPSSEGGLSEEQQKDVAQFQMDNAFLQQEVQTMRKRVAHQAATSQNYSWVEILLSKQMNASSMARLKRRFQKKSGVPL